MQNWYVARTKPRREVATATILAQRGIEVYLPVTAMRRRAPTRSAPGEPLFPGYLFAHIDINDESWLAARSAPGIAYFLGSELAPSPLPDDLIAAIRMRADLQSAQEPVIPFQQGDAVVIRSGPFAGIEAVFDGCLSGRGRVRVLLEMLERYVPVALDVYQLEKPSSGRGFLSAAG